MITVRTELESIVQQVRAHEWVPDLFDRCRALLGYVDVFNILRRKLPPEEYERFDLAYCNYIRPEKRELNEYLTEERKAREWKERKRALLLKKRRLLSGK